MDGSSPHDEGMEIQTMMEITGIGMGLMMTSVAVAIGGLMLEATFEMLGRALRSAPLAASTAPVATHLSYVG